ncbi:MAG: DUF120 domain-containing protein [Candidatus Micrarchaeota archaeon]
MKKTELHLLFLLKNAPGLKGTECARILAVPQQTVSRWIIYLQKKELLKQTGFGYCLSEKGSEVLKSLLELRPNQTFSFTGKVVPGFREGGYYMGLAGYSDQFKEKLGFIPFPGTLNVKLSSNKDLRNNELLRGMKGILIEGFKEGDRVLGQAQCFKAWWNDVEGAVLIPKRTHYASNVMELIFPIDLRKKGVKDGIVLSIKVEV